MTCRHTNCGVKVEFHGQTSDRLRKSVSIISLSELLAIRIATVIPENRFVELFSSNLTLTIDECELLLSWCHIIYDWRRLWLSCRYILKTLCLCPILLYNFIISLLYLFLVWFAEFFLWYLVIYVEKCTFITNFACIIMLFEFRKSVHACWNLFSTILIHISMDVMRCLSLLLLILLLNDIITVFVDNHGVMITLIRCLRSVTIFEIVERSASIAAVLRIHTSLADHHNRKILQTWARIC